MKIISIESPQKLKGGRAKATITVKLEDFIPLVIMGDEADKGNELDLDVRKSDNETKADELPDFIRSMWTRYAQDVKEAYVKGLSDGQPIKKVPFNDGINEGINTNIGNPDLAAIKEGVKSSVFKTLVESPERQEDVVKAAEMLKDSQPIMGSLEDANRDGY